MWKNSSDVVLKMFTRTYYSPESEKTGHFYKKASILFNIRQKRNTKNKTDADVHRCSAAAPTEDTEVILYLYQSNKQLYMINNCTFMEN